jgi:hypothetical protein
MTLTIENDWKLGVLELLFNYVFVTCNIQCSRFVGLFGAREKNNLYSNV